MESRDTCIFYRSIFEAIQGLPKETQADVYNAIFDYSLNFKQPELTGISQVVWKLVEPVLTKGNTNYINGKQPKQKRTGSETKATWKRNETEPEAYKDKYKDKDKDKDKDVFVATAPKQKKNKEVFFRDSQYFENPELFCADWYATKTATEHPQIDPQILYDSIKLTTDATDKYKYANWIAAAQNWAKRDPKQYYARTGIEQFSRGTQELHRRNETLSQLAYDPITGRPWDE